MERKTVDTYQGQRVNLSTKDDGQIYTVSGAGAEALSREFLERDGATNSNFDRETGSFTIGGAELSSVLKSVIARSR